MLVFDAPVLHFSTHPVGKDGEASMIQILRVVGKSCVTSHNRRLVQRCVCGERKAEVQVLGNSRTSALNPDIKVENEPEVVGF